MHEAYALLPPGKINAQIECIAGYDNFIFLGTRHGHLMQYSIEPNESDARMQLQMLQYDKNFSKKNIVQIEVVPESRLIFSLSGDKQININDICQHNFPLVYTEPKTRGATLFTLNVKKTVSTTGDTSWLIQLCVAVKRKLQFYVFKKDKLEDVSIRDINLSDVPKTMSWLNDAICLGFDAEYVVYKLDSEVPEKVGLFPPSSAKTIFPYIYTVNEEVFALAKDEFTMLIDPNHPQLTEKKDNAQGASPRHQVAVKGKGVRTISKLHRQYEFQWAQPLKTFVWDEPFALGLLADSVEVRDLSRPKGEPLQVIKDLTGVRYLVRTGSGQLFAASVSQLWHIKMNDIPKQIEQLRNRDFELSLQLIAVDRVRPEEVRIEDKKRVQSLYAHHLFNEKRFQDSMDQFIAVGADPTMVIKLFPSLGLKDSNASQMELDEREVEKALLALQYFLAAVRPPLKHAYDKGNMNPEFYGRTAQIMLSIIDTTMLNCCLQTKESLVTPLLRLNHCQLEESERMLKKYQKHRELIILYQTKGQHRMALDLLKSMAESEGTTGLNGPAETIRYLQSLGSEHMPLICEYSNWVLERDPEEGLKIFTVDMETVEQLSRSDVLDFLLKNHKAAAIPYLEHLINNWQDQKPLFHNISIQVYRDKIRELELKNGKGSKEAEEYRNKLFNFLKQSKFYNAEAVLKDFPTNDFFHERAIILQRSKQHKKVLQVNILILGDYKAALDYCETNYRSRACPELDNPDDKEDSAQNVYFNLIQILLAKPMESPYKDVPLHENCNDKWLIMEQVFSILDSHGTKVSAQRVIEILPDDVPLERVKKFLETALHFQLEQRRKTQILGRLLYADNLLIHEERIKVESKCVTITEFSVCPICKKKFNNQSAFVRHPNGDIVHYSCQQKYKL